MVTRRVRPRRVGTAGLTLVELMVTLVIAGLVTSSTFIFFAGQQNIYDTQTKILNIQQNLWAAMETLTRNVRASGTGMVGCIRPDSDLAGADTGDPPPGTNGPVAPLTGLRAFQAPTGMIRLAPLWIQNGAAGAPDRLTVVYGNGTSGNWADANLGTPMATSTAAMITAPGMARVFRTNEFVIVLDSGATPASTNWNRGCSLFRITGIINATDTLLHASTSPWNPPADVPTMMLPTPYQAGASGGVRNFGQLVWVQFFIDTTQAFPRLMMTRLDTAMGPQVLAEGVEDLQIAYACDRLPAGPPSGDGVLSEGSDPGTRAADEWVFNTPGDPIPPACNRPQAVRITLVARSNGEDDSLASNMSNFKPGVEDGVIGAQDRFRHRTITTTVYPRN